jgi:hypothetical protein
LGSAHGGDFVGNGFSRESVYYTMPDNYQQNLWKNSGMDEKRLPPELVRGQPGILGRRLWALSIQNRQSRRRR